MPQSPINFKAKVDDVKVVGVEKRKRNATKNFEFVIKVKWSDDEECYIFRQYSMFFDLQANTVARFEKCHPTRKLAMEGGLSLLYEDKYQVTIPYLPVPKFSGRGILFSALAKKECKVIEDFCEKIIRLPSVVSESDIVVKFFSEWATDTVDNQGHYLNQQSNSRGNLARTHSNNPDKPQGKQTEQVVERYRSVAQYVASTSGEMSLEENELLTVIEKNQTGWWFVTNEKGQHGFAPATFLQPLDPSRESEAEEWVDYDGESRCWVAILPYTAQSDDEVSYHIGEEMEVVATSSFGWWKVRCRGKVGVTPASNLKSKEKIADSEPSYASVRDLTKRASFTASPIYASIKRPPPRRDSSSKMMLAAAKLPSTTENEPLEYAVVQITSTTPFQSSSASSPDGDDSMPEYATVIPKHLRPKRSSNPTNDQYDQPHEEVRNKSPSPPPVPVLRIDPITELTLLRSQPETETPVLSLNQRSRSDVTSHQDSVTIEKQDEEYMKKHCYMNVLSADEMKDSASDLYVTVTSYKAPADKPEDLVLEAGCTVRVKCKDGPFYFVSTLEDPSRQGWVPDYVLDKKNKEMMQNGQRRSRSVGDIMAGTSQEDFEIRDRLRGIHVRTPQPVPRNKALERTVRYHSVDATGDPNFFANTLLEVGYQRNGSSAASEVWYQGKMTRQTCEDIMLKNAKELEFLVRESTQKFASFVLSVTFSGKIRHFPIERTPRGKFVIGKHAFDSLPEIVQFYKVHPLFYTQNKEPISLGAPFSVP